MNLLARARPSSAYLIFSSPSPRRCLFYIHPIAAPLQQCSFFSSKAAYSSQKTQQATKPRTQKSSQSSSSFTQRIKKQAEALATVWPKPREMPYQEKVSNFVNLIGHIRTPVRFEAASDGKHFSTTVISLGNGGERNSLSIPVVFEGDLAHVVACHVKENDCVFVSGQLSVDPVRLVSSESLGKFHVVAENLNFVQGLEKNFLDKKLGVETDKPGKHGAKKIEEVIERVDNDPYFMKQLGEVLKNQDTRRVESSVKQSRNADSVSAPPTATLECGKDESVREKCNGRNGGIAIKKKGANQNLDLWRDLVKNPLQWWDYRDHKSNGLVKEKFPDFKQKVTEEALWVTSAPEWVLHGLGKLEFDVKPMKQKQMQGGERPGERKKSGKLDHFWKDLVENPDNWWDNRAQKKNPKAPDFKNKETGEVLWLSSSPGWALSRLPPMKDG
ncbi:protein OSB3, chloroplastic/mitochondrial-like [Sesamum indicum]|uniref:Protein OSB3, chloroplastic/mitochondrial-like n=1 Tax=Sesamum indicum TaxID=4182 RepID=A0A6I9U2Z2_SESIN|nr:protein OSB3, chloroplastic/mitochondrial-like [Sesamum indicum]